MIGFDGTDFFCIGLVLCIATGQVSGHGMSALALVKGYSVPVEAVAC